MSRKLPIRTPEKMANNAPKPMNGTAPVEPPKEEVEIGLGEMNVTRLAEVLSALRGKPIFIVEIDDEVNPSAGFAIGTSIKNHDAMVRIASALSLIVEMKTNTLRNQQIAAQLGIREVES